MENPELKTGKWRISSPTPGNENEPPCQSLGENLYFDTRAEADKGLILSCNLGVVDLIQSGLGEHWVQFSLASALLIATQPD